MSDKFEVEDNGHNFSSIIVKNNDHVLFGDDCSSNTARKRSKDLTIEIKSESNEEKRIEEVILDNNTDSNKSNNNFMCPSLPSSTSNKDLDYMTPKSMHNLNLLFTESNGKKSQTQRRIINNMNIESPLDNRGYLNYPYNIPISPIDPMKMNSKQMSSSIPTKNNIAHPPNYAFNNNDGIMLINIQHKHIYDSRIFGKIEKLENHNKRFNRKIEFTPNNNINNTMGNNFKDNSCSKRKSSTSSIVESSSDNDNNESHIKKPQPIIPTSNRSIMNNDSIYLTPFQPFNRSQVMPFNQLQTISLQKITMEEYEKRTKQELKKKKNTCNCKRSKCLKLYCECFANGEFCVNCNCQDCSNVIGNEEEKDEAFKSSKDKNPVAMKLNNIKELLKEENPETKIGCNCTKSNCSKKYCECYKAGIECTEICRCRDCSNASDRCKEDNKKITPGHKQSFPSYDCDAFVVDKISILIEHKKIYIDKFRDDAKNYYHKSLLTSSLNQNFINHNCLVKNINNSFIIELSKSLINLANQNISNNSQTPILNKFKKRQRNMSHDSCTSIEKSEYTKKYTKTACETSYKKTSFKETMNDVPKVIAKKLNLEEFDSR